MPACSAPGARKPRSCSSAPRRADSGTAEVDGKPVALASPQARDRRRFGFCPEDRKTDGIIGDLSVRENIVLALQARRGWARPISRAEQDELADRYIKALDIRTDGREKPIKLLSGGNQQKAILARWLATNPQLLILDEPTRGIDVGAHAEIIQLIRESLRAGHVAARHFLGAGGTRGLQLAHPSCCATARMSRNSSARQ